MSGKDLTEDRSKRIQSALLSHCSATGHFDRTNGHTPKNAPGHGITASITLRALRYVRARSGLASTTLRAEWRLELYRPLESGPEDGVDPELAAATIAVFARISEDLTLGGLVDEVPLLGADGAIGLLAQQRYVMFDGGTKYRLVEITVETVHDDVLIQAR